MRKKRIGFITSSPLLKTGFSRSIKALLPYLYKNRPDCEFFLLHQGLHDETPDFKKMPWNNSGAITPHIHNIINNTPIQDRGQVERIASYGNYRVEDWVISNKLDAVLAIEDPWAFQPDAYFKKDWFQFIKNNFALWITADSLPIIPLVKDWAKNCPNTWMWTSFAEKALKEEDEKAYGHVKTIHGTLNASDFKPISESERKELRKKFNIKEDETLILHLGRNQLRKLFFSNIEALAKHKKLHNEKVKLLLHCDWKEGWPLEETVKEFGLNKEDVLATYFCQHCGHWEVRPFEGQPNKCPSCNYHQNTFVTAGITSNITETDLSKIYGICDAASSPFTSGGLEYFNVESLLCELPLLCTPYSCGTDFTDQPFVDSIDGSYTREVGSNFLKFVPNANSIVKFFDKIAKMPRQKRKEIGKRGREWALKEFDVNYISKKIEQFIDSSNLINWDDYHCKKSEYDVKSPEAEVVSSMESDVEFVKGLYKNILKMDMDDSDSGLQSWVQNFNNIQPGLNDQRVQIRKQIEMSFRKIAVDHNQKNNPIDFKSLIDLDRPNSRMLFAVPESGGDVMICASLLEDAKIQYGEDVDIYVMVKPQFKEILEGNPNIYKVLPWFEPMANEMVAINSGGEEKDRLFDYFFFPTVSTQKYLNYLSHKHSRQIKK